MASLKSTEKKGEAKYVIVGKIGAPYGVRGWVKIFSYTDPTDNLLNYDPWYFKAVLSPELSPESAPASAPEPVTDSTDCVDSWPIASVSEAKTHGKGLVAIFKGCKDRDGAARLTGREIAIRRDQLPPADEDEYYWSDLQGLSVVTLDGVTLGVVDHLLETGANDVLVVVGDRERLIPYVLGPIVTAIDLKAGIMRVDWDPEFD